jgi:3'(2'), 5'-bisphosphate nucleotidase
LTLIPNIYLTAIKASIEASEVIMDIYKSDFKATMKKDGSPVTQADIAASKIIYNHLVKTNIPVLGEELEKDDFFTRSKWKENWCVDPLDGTRMFLMKNDEFSVNIAHVVGNSSVFGVIASPTENKVIFGGKKVGVYTSSFNSIDKPEYWKKVNSKNITNTPLTITCSRSFKHGSDYKYMKEFEDAYGEMVYIRKGSALKFFDLAEGRADIYPRFAPTMEWDIAAGQAIVEALGGEILDVNSNKALTYNKEDLYNPFFIAKMKSIIS